MNTVTMTLTREEAVKVLAFLATDLSTTTPKAIPEATPTAKKPAKAKPAPKKVTKEEVAPEPKEEVAPEPAKDVEVTLGELKTEAKAAVGRTDVNAVKKCISRYGQKLAEVTENNYANLFADLKAL